MVFRVELYKTSSGNCPVRDFLEDLRKWNSDDHVAVIAGIAKLRNSMNHRPPLSKPLGNGLYELRHVGKLNTRVIYFFVRGRRIVVVHGVRNKAQAFRQVDLDTALARKQDWTDRNRP